LKKEMNTMVTIWHPNLISLIGLTVTLPLCRVTAFLPNRSLTDLIHHNGCPRNAGVTEVARVECLHARRVVDRGREPANIFIHQSERGTVRDFWLARAVAVAVTAGSKNRPLWRQTLATRSTWIPYG
jgi:hypothetical protein